MSIDIGIDNEELSEVIDYIGHPIDQKLQNIIKAKFLTNLRLEKCKEKFKKYKTPENCLPLFIPKVNEHYNLD